MAVFARPAFSGSRTCRSPRTIPTTFSPSLQDEELELTFSHDGRSYELGTRYGHIALAVDDLDGTVERLKEEGTEPDAAVPGKGGRSRLCFMSDRTATELN